MEFYGKYRGICRDIHDPKQRGRIRAEVPYPLGTGALAWSLWAEPCFQANAFQVPEEGDGVWIEFEGGDPGKPIWSGIWYKGAGKATEAPFQEVHAPLTDWDGAEVDSDKLDHTDPEEIDDLEHREYHDHRAGEFYTPHRFGWRSHTGHVIEFNDHPGRTGSLRINDRMGRGIDLLARGVVRLRGHLATKVSGFVNDLNGSPAEAVNEIVSSDYHNEELHGTDEALPGLVKLDAAAKVAITPSKWYLSLRGMATHFLRFVADPGKEELRLGDFWGQHFQIKSVKGGEYVEVLDKAGQYIRLDVASGTLRLQDKEGNSALMEQGKITVTATSGNIVLNVPSGSNVHIGGEGGEELATRTFVQAQYNTHTHLSGSPGSPTGPPMTPSPLTPGSDITKKQRSE